MADLYIDGHRFGGASEVEYNFTDSEQAEKFDPKSLKFEATLEFEYGDSGFFDSLMNMILQKERLNRSYAVSLALMSGYGLAVVEDAYETSYWIAPRIPYRQMYVIPATVWEERADLSWGARMVEL